MKIHRNKTVKVAHNHTCGNTEAAAQCNAQMSKLTAHTLPLLVDFYRRKLKENW